MSDKSLRLVSVQQNDQSAGGSLIASSCRPIGFGEFMAFPASRTLMRRGEAIELGGRAFDLLMVLLRSRGALVTRQEIVRYVWPSTTVDESNLRFQMACLRKALGAARDYIKTVPGRGYLFVSGDAEDTGAEYRVPELPARIKPLLNDGPAIFVIDGDDVIRQALDRLLRSFDARVASFTSVEALLESAATSHRTSAV